MGHEVHINIDGQDLSLPVVEGSEHEKALDIGKLRAQTGYITLDPGYVNTGACQSSICFIDGEKGILRYRGYPIEEIADQACFLETAYLLLYGELPTQSQLDGFRVSVKERAEVPSALGKLCEAVSSDAHPMSVLASMVNALSSYGRDWRKPTVEEQREKAIRDLLGKLPTVAAMAFRRSRGLDPIAPRADLPYAANFLNMMFGEVNLKVAEALDKILILHADHEQNCSTSTVRIVGSSEANLYASIAAGICALWGPLHGGANQRVIEMLETIHNSGDGPDPFVDKVKDKTSGVRLMGFGHRVYKNFDPRAKILKKACDEVLATLGIEDPLLDIAKSLEKTALEDEYFISRQLYPNVDFYSGIIYRAIGIPTNMFTVMFALGRLPGWMAHWRELHEDPARRIGRPRQIYTGPTQRKMTPIGQR
ncbi:MAG: citrate synthase [Planctomycetes bacterium]|nr:citrate synthase [Planctomycetota bacterium]